MSFFFEISCLVFCKNCVIVRAYMYTTMDVPMQYFEDKVVKDRNLNMQKIRLQFISNVISLPSDLFNIIVLNQE